MTDALIKTEIVFDAISESTLIAAACLDTEARARLTRRLSPDYFLSTQHKAIWAALTRMVQLGLAFDLPTLRALAGVDAPAGYLEQLIAHAPQGVALNEEFHVGKLLWQRARAEAAAGPLTQLLEDIRKPQSDPARVAMLATALARGLTESGDDLRHLRQPADVVREALADLDAKMAGTAFFPYGIDALDFYEATTTLAPKWIPRAPNGRQHRMIPGAAPGLITTITGTSGSGKSFLAKLLALLQAGMGRRVLYGAWEETEKEILQEMAAISLGLSRARVRLGTITAEERLRIAERMERISAWVRFLPFPFSRQPSAARDPAGQALRNMDTLQAYIEKSQAAVYFCDLFDRALDNDDPRVAKPVLFRVQKVSEETKAHGFLLAQQKIKGFENTRKDNRPTRENIMGSQAWVDISDAILGMYRPSLYKAVSDDVAELIVLKQRRGPWPIIVEVDLDMDRGRITGGTTRSFDIGEESEDLGVHVSRGTSGKRGFAGER